MTEKELRVENRRLHEAVRELKDRVTRAEEARHTAEVDRNLFRALAVNPHGQLIAWIRKGARPDLPWLLGEVGRTFAAANVFHVPQ